MKTPRAAMGPRLAVALAVFLGLVAWRLWPRPSAVETVVVSGAAMGTVFHVTVVEAPAGVGPPQVRRAVAEALEAVEVSMSTWRPESELSVLSRADAGDWVAASAPLLEVLGAAFEVSERSGGAFDVTVAPLVDVWGFGPGGGGPPDEAAVEQAKASVGFRRLVLEDGGVRKVGPGVRVDLSAIAKGYGVDRAAAALSALGASRFLVEVGGEVRASGLNAKGTAWQVGVERPEVDGQGVQRVVALGDEALATSGDYRNFYEVDGGRVSHTIDPRTGRPISHGLASVTVVHRDCMHADAWATALNVLGVEAGAAVARREGLSVLFLSHAADGGFEERGTGRFAAVEKTE